MAAVAALKRAGITTWLLSGDRPEAAGQVAVQWAWAIMVAGATPENKLTELVALQNKGHRVAMVGDGLNDGPVLARANTSFALGTAAPLAQAQSDFVIQGGMLIEVPSRMTRPVHYARCSPEPRLGRYLQRSQRPTC